MLHTVDGRWGQITYFSKDEYVGKSIRYYGEYNPDETEMILELAQPGRLCLDIGANIGVMTQALEANGYKCIAFEPQPEVCKVLQQNINGVAHNVALAATAGTAKMPKLHYDDRNNIGGMELNTASIFGTIDVEVRTLDSYAFENVGFIKLDVEGYELQVLQGGRETILRCRPVLYVEDDRYHNSAALRAYITELGYTITDHRPQLYRPQNFFNHSKNVWNRPYASHNIICKPGPV